MKGLPRQTYVLAAGVFLALLGITLVAPILPLYAREFGVSRTAAGGLISAFAIARFIFDPAGGVLSDRFGARRVMLVGALVLAVSSVAAALAPNYGTLFASRVLEGFGSAAFANAAMHSIVVITPIERRGRAMAIYQTGLLGGISIGPIIGGYAADLGDFATPFWIYAGVGLVLAAVVWFGIDDVESEPVPLRTVYRASGRLLRTPAYLALLVVAFAIFVMRSGAQITLLPLYGGEELGLDEPQIGLLIAVAAVMMLLVVNPGGWLVDRVGRRPVLIGGLLATAIAVGSYGFARSFGTLLLVSVGFGVAAAFMGIPPPTLAGDLAPPGAEGASVGLYRMAADLGLVIGPLWLGAIADGGDFRLGFLIAAALLAAAAVVSLAINEPDRTSARARIEEPL